MTSGGGGGSSATMRLLPCVALLMGSWCCAISHAQATPRCLLAEQERAAFMGELLKEAKTGSGGPQQAHELRRLVHSVLDNNSWREVGTMFLVLHGRNPIKSLTTHNSRIPDSINL